VKKKKVRLEEMSLELRIGEQGGVNIGYWRKRDRNGNKGYLRRRWCSLKIQGKTLERGGRQVFPLNDLRALKKWLIKSRSPKEARAASQSKSNKGRPGGKPGTRVNSEKPGKRVFSHRWEELEFLEGNSQDERDEGEKCSCL